MDNQHRKIAGYRDLTQEEIDLMNAIKGLGPVIEEVLDRVSSHLENQRMEVDTLRLRDMDRATPERFAAMAKTEFQTGLMYLTRAVAQPLFL